MPPPWAYITLPPPPLPHRSGFESQVRPWRKDFFFFARSSKGGEKHNKFFTPRTHTRTKDQRAKVPARRERERARVNEERKV